jgi:hypothetical protein
MELERLIEVPTSHLFSTPPGIGSPSPSIDGGHVGIVALGGDSSRCAFEFSTAGGWCDEFTHFRD